MPLHPAWHSYTCYGFAEYTSSVSSGFCSYLLDTPSRSYILGNGYRLYNPTMMRFASADGESPFAHGGKNAYCYCGGDPVNRLDGSGRSWSNALVYKRAELIPNRNAISTEQLRALKKIKIAKLSPTFKAKFRATRSTKIDKTDYAEIAPLVEYESIVNATRAYLYMMNDRRFIPKAIGMSRRDYSIAMSARNYVFGPDAATITPDQRSDISRRHIFNLKGFSMRMGRLREARDLVRLELARNQQGLPKLDNARTPAERLPL